MNFISLYLYHLDVSFPLLSVLMILQVVFFKFCQCVYLIVIHHCWYKITMYRKWWSWWTALCLWMDLFRNVNSIVFLSFLTVHLSSWYTGTWLKERVGEERERERSYAPFNPLTSIYVRGKMFFEMLSL